MENITNATTGTGCKIHLTNDYTAATIKTVALSILGVLAVICNSLVLAVLGKNREMQTITNIFIANMAVSDLIFGVTVIPKEIILQLYNNIWFVPGDFGSFLCKFVNFAQDVSTAVSIYSHVAIAIERFYAVVFPLQARRASTTLRVVVVATTWVISIGYHSIYFYTLRLIPVGGGEYTCQRIWGEAFGNPLEVEENFYLVIFASLYAIPLVIIAVLYCLLLYKLNVRHVVGSDFTMRSAHQVIQNKRIVRLAISIVVIFAVLWAPVHVLFFHVIFKWHWDVPCGFQNLYFSAFFLAMMSCFTNPLIYFIFSENYRNGLKNLCGSCLAIHPRIFPGHQNTSAGGEITEGAQLESRSKTMASRIQRQDRSNTETTA